MRSKFYIILILLVLGGIPLQVSPSLGNDQEPGTVPAPSFISITPDSNPSGSNIYSVNTTITLTYEASRFDVDGIILLGFGSNLTTELTNPRALNFSVSSSFRDKSTYVTEFNVTSYTTFYAYSWSVGLNNGTMEEFNFEDGSEFHQLWVEEGPKNPVFSDIKNAELRDDQYYVPLGTEITIEYIADDPIDVNDTYVQLVLANTTQNLYNETQSIRVNMTQTEFSVNNQSRFVHNYTLNQRILFFTAFNSYGWERSSSTTNLYHRITTGFSFNVSYSQNLNQYTELDDIEFNVSSYNETSSDKFNYRYRVFDNETAEDPVTPWQNGTINHLNISTTLVNNTDNYNTSKTIYGVNLGKFKVDQKVEVQSYVEYLSGSYNESIVPDVIIIKDSRPSIVITSANNTYTGNENATIIFSYETIRGSILDATIVSNTTNQASIKSLHNFTVSFRNATGEILQGTHTVTINVTNTLSMYNSSIAQNQSRVVIILYKVDHTPPVVSYDGNNPSVTDENGYITLSFSYSDNTPLDSDIKYVTLSWGNGLVINATDLGKATMKYRRAGNYTVTLTAYDNVGNKNNISREITATVQTTEESTARTTPFLITYVFISIITSVVILRKRSIRN
ncbi:MAG: PKD domain-containing protein [Candidatus Kariarchaeaceae archaeon]|jgi:hypothetical protein